MRTISIFILTVITLFFYSNTLFSQGDNSLDNLTRTVTYFEDFDDENLLFKKTKPLGKTSAMEVKNGMLEMTHTKKGNGFLFIPETNPGIMDGESIEFEMRFKMPSNERLFRAVFDLGQEPLGRMESLQANPLRLDVTPERVILIDKKSIGVIEIKKKVEDIYKKDDFNTVKFIRHKSEISLYLNDELLGKQSYHKRAIYRYYSEKLNPATNDMLIKLYNPEGSIDYIKVSELSKATKAYVPEKITYQQQVKPAVTAPNNNNNGFNFSETVKTKPAQVQNPSNFTVQGKYYAIIIGNDEYQDPTISSLDQPIKDATKLYNVLTSEYTFEKRDVLLLTNATRTNIIEALDALSNNLTENDNLLIFYAGHGYWNEEKETGYWLPVDAKKSNTANWLRNSTVQGYLDEIPTKHTLLIADACFGGGIFKTRKAFNDAPPSIESLYKLKSRKGITSGMLNEVPDRSVFMEYLTKRLSENDQKYVSSLDMFTQFRVAVMNNSNNTPQYGTIHNTGDEGGDFIFIKRTK